MLTLFHLNTGIPYYARCRLRSVVIVFETRRDVLVTGNTGQAIKIARGVLEPGSEYEVALAYFERT